SAVNGEPVATWNDVAERLSASGSGPLTLRFSDGQEVALALPGGETERFEILERIQPFAEPLIGSVNAGSPAEVGGMRENDRVLRAAGVPIRSWTEFVDVIRAHP